LCREKLFDLKHQGFWLLADGLSDSYFASVSFFQGVAFSTIERIKVSHSDRIISALNKQL